MLHRIGFALLLCAYVQMVMGLAAEAAPAQAEAEALIREGLKLRKNGKDEAALGRFEQAADLQRTGRALAQIALAEQALGRWVEAEAHLVEALRFEDETWIKRNRSLLTSALAEMADHLADLEVVGNVSGALVLINGIERGRLPLPQPLRVPLGTTTLEVQASGHFPVVRSVLMTAHARVRETITMVREPQLVEPAAGLRAGPLPSVSQTNVAPLQVTESWPWQKTAGVTALVGAGAFLALGVVSTGLQWIKFSQAKDDGCTRNSSDAACSSLEQSMNAHGTRAVIGYAGAAVLGGVGGLMLWLSPGAPSGTRSALMLDVSGRF